MTTEAQVLANRSNAAKSTGPRTKTGKAIVAQNAIKHGLFAHQDVIAEEDPQQYQEHRQRLLGELSPASEMETILAGRIVSLTWRLKRAERLQNELFDYLLAKELEDSMGHFFPEMTDKDQEQMRRYVDTNPTYAVGRMIARDYRGEKTLDRLGMHERRIEGSLYRTMNELHRLRLTPKKEGVRGTPYKSEPAGEENDCAKQSQSEEVSSGVGSAVADDPACETKPIQGTVKCEAPSATPEDGALPLQTSHITLQTSPEPPCGVTTSGADCAKQSQCPRPAPGAKALLRPRPRVAWHYHNA